MVSDKSGTLIYKGLSETTDRGCESTPGGAPRGLRKEHPHRRKSQQLDGHGAAGHLNKTSQKRGMGGKSHQQGLGVL